MMNRLQAFLIGLTGRDVIAVRDGVALAIEPKDVLPDDKILAGQHRYQAYLDAKDGK